MIPPLCKVEKVWYLQHGVALFDKQNSLNRNRWVCVDNIIIRFQMFNQKWENSNQLLLGQLCASVSMRALGVNHYKWMIYLVSVGIEIFNGIDFQDGIARCNRWLKIAQDIFRKEVNDINTGIDTGSTMLTIEKAICTLGNLNKHWWDAHDESSTWAVPLFVAIAVNKKMAVFLSFQCASGLIAYCCHGLNFSIM